MNRNQSIPSLPRNRIFLVGCPRSGTTLLQSMLAAHPAIASFPESHFFVKLLPRPVLRSFGIASRRARNRLNQFLLEIGRSDLSCKLSRTALFMNQHTRAFVEILDTITEQQGKQLWVEKTPLHLHYIELIQSLIPEASFIHIVRNGSDVIASMYEVTQKHPDAWQGARSIEQCVTRWLNDIEISRSFCDRPNHALVSYENLVEEPRSTLEQLCCFIGIPFDDSMLKEYCRVAKTVSLSDEPWKQSTQNTLLNANGRKFYQVFDELQRQQVMSRIGEVSMPSMSF